MTPLANGACCESPSLASWRDPSGPAFELKFLLDDPQGREVEAWAQARLQPDPHGDASLGGAYSTTSVYCDTPELDVYHRTPSYKARKYRVRRYGDASWAFLERKTKRGDRVAKRRTFVSLEELSCLSQSPLAPNWPGAWFHQRLAARRLGPACRIAYLRTAYIGSCPEGPLRLTLDRSIRGLLTDEWHAIAPEAGLHLLTGQVIVEMKFRWALPAPFKELTHDLRLRPTVVSKYGLCRKAWELHTASGGRAHA